jgi:hypothetical protein
MTGNTGECKDAMKGYLECMKKNKGMNDPECRNLAKSYLGCRIERCVDQDSVSSGRG